MALILLAVSSTVCQAQPGTATALINETPLDEADRDHWAFRPLSRVGPPEVRGAEWVRNPIDRFILARLEKEGLSPLPPAERTTLVRRLSFDLTGLPPSAETVAAFAADPAPDAYEKLVDRLLALPAYGERWAQHWLDLARFAETDGFEHDHVRPEAWRYRDWIIEALNRDLPYDEFVRRQVAGDELAPDDKGAYVATGFLLAGPDMPDINSQDERRHTLLNEMTGTVGSVFLGLQIGCAQCHDHKFDPLSQADFYRLRAVFESAELFKANPLGRVMHEAALPAKPSHLMVRGDFRRPGPEVQPAFPRIANPWLDTIAPPAPEARGAGRRAALARWLTRPDHPLSTRVIVNRIWQHHVGQGLVRTPSDFGLMGNAPTHPKLLDWLATELVRQEWSLKRMHQLIVSSTTYRQASRPQSPDWPADVAAAAQASWRQSRQVDPENRLLARMNRMRLEGEAIRDAMLFSAGRLSQRRGGSGVMPPLPDELVSTLLPGQWQVSPDEQDHRRRSIYLFVRRNLRYPLFEAFDRPDAGASCARRDRSTTAPQALVLVNSAFSLEQARHLAGRVLSQCGEQDGAGMDTCVDLCFLRTLSRRPTASERQATRAFLAAQAARLREEGRRPDEFAQPIPFREECDPYEGAALVDLCLAMFNLNEFVYVD